MGVHDQSTTVLERGARQGSFDVADFPVPTGKEEEWRFTPRRRLRGLHDGTAPRGVDPTITVRAEAAIEVVRVTQGDPRLGQVGAPEDRVSALAWNGVTEATVVTIPQEHISERPIEIDIAGSGSEGVGYGHIVIDIAAFARAQVVLRHTGSVLYADNVEIRVGDSADLTVVSIANWAGDSVHLGDHRARIGRDASFKHVAVSLGGDVVRQSLSVQYDAPGGSVELLGLYFADDGQHLEHRTFVDHDAPQCRSNVMYKGALQGAHARTVWIGDVLIRAGAEGTDTYELNRNLLLTDGARADSVPNLEIETGEIVGAGHASATGRFDDEQMFYLQSRGIPADLARRLVVRGFFVDVLQRIGLPDIESELDAAIEAELSRSTERPS